MDSPAPGGLLADSVPDLAALAGPVVGCSGPRGEVRPSNGGYAVLGQLIADVTGSPYDQAVTRLVLEPLGMSGSSFPPAQPTLAPMWSPATTSHQTALVQVAMTNRLMPLESVAYRVLRSWTGPAH